MFFAVAPHTVIANTGAQVERETGFEPATPSLEGWRSTAELFPLNAEPFSTLEPRVPLVAAPFSAHPRPEPGSWHPLQWWGGEDLNPRRRTPADLQSAPFGHLGTSPNPPARTWQLPEKAGAGGRI